MLGINRNIMECKFIITQISEEEKESINRNIMECKYYVPAENKQVKKRINRNIMECKFNTIHPPYLS